MEKNQNLEKKSAAEETRTRYRTPRVDIFENEKEVLLFADLPGVEADGVQVQLDAPELKLEGKLADGPAFFRTFRVDESIDADSVEAVIERGVLKVQLKKSVQKGPRRIAVRAVQGS